MEGLELLCFRIISSVGSAKSEYIEAIQCAKKASFSEAYQKMAEGDKSFVLGHAQHASLIQSEANGENVVASLLLIHAEDQMMSAEDFKLLAIEFIQMYERLYGLETQHNTKEKE
ncbi:MAG: PTS lactose/cellobiose transporter subunit IIA [Erysipelotrichaceae bacterium]|uniref:PTS lactose/cellobiose transporter subunit IIA n=1 Tax=Anaerorhabdus sp. TaxID=1872524 RepID=UPI002FC8864B